MDKRLDTYNWASAFEYAGEPYDEERSGYGYGSADVRTHPGSGVSTEPFGREDVVAIYQLIEGENDGPSWICVGLLRDGRFFVLEAGCDYTGWDCQAGGSAHVAATYEDAITFGLDDHGRSRLDPVRDAG